MKDDTMGKLSRLSIFVYDTANALARGAYNEFRKMDYSVPKEEAVANMDAFVRKVGSYGGSMLYRPRMSRKRQIRAMGKYYMAPDDVRNTDEDALWQAALEYDMKGIIPQKDEALPDFAYRGNSLLFLHSKFREKKLKPHLEFDEKKYDVSVGIEWSPCLIETAYIEEANRKIPYHMDLSWANAFVDTSPLMSMVYGACFTIPKYNGLNFIFVRERYRSRKKFIGTLAHEMAHMGTVYMDTRKDFMETKAYQAGTAAFGEWTIAVSQRPHLIHRGISWAMMYLLRVQLPRFTVTLVPKVQSAIAIAERRALYSKARQRLKNLYGDDIGNYMLGRLTADEIEEFFYTNDVAARIGQKNDLKWRIMKENRRRLEEKLGV